MVEQLKRILESVASRWNGMSPGQRFATGSLLATALVTIAVTALLARHATYAVLYAGLDPEQANAVVEELRDRKVSHRLKDGGRTILVPEKDVYETRIDLAGQGLPGGGGVGFEIFDKHGFGMTNFMQQVNYRRALEGELTRTIAEMDEVLGARVHLNVPERTLFMDESRQPSASVMLRLKPGARLSRKQAEGISYLVAGSVEGLSADHVNILDFYGNLIAGSEMAGLEGESTARMEIKASVERWLEDKGQSLLDRVVGPGNAVVRVTAELDFERVERDVEMYDPENAVVRSEELSEESKTEGGEYRNTVTNYEINRTVEKLVKAPGTVERLTVAVTVDGLYEEAGGGDENAEPVFTPRSAAELNELAAIVKNAVGLDERRGDQFHIACVQFNHQYLDQQQKEMKRVERQMLIQTVVRYGFLLVAAGAAFLVLRKVFRSISQTLAQLPRGTREPVEAGGTAGEGRPGAEAAGMNVLVNRVSDAARRQPQESAALIRNMITESD